MVYKVRHQLQWISKDDGRPVAQDEARVEGQSRQARAGLGCIACNVACFALLLALSRGARSQAPTHGIDPTYNTPTVTTTASEGLSDPYADDPAAEERRQLEHRIELRQSVVSSTDKLLKLAHELDAEVSRTNPERLTNSELKKVAQIEKLAHKVKTKMTEYDRGTPPMRPFPVSPVGRSRLPAPAPEFR